MVVSCKSPLPNRIYVVLRGALGHSDHYSTFLKVVRGRFDRHHADSVCEGFASRAEDEAYCLGATRIWPQPLPRLD